MDFIYLDYIVPACVLLPLAMFIRRPKAYPGGFKILSGYLLTSSLINTAAILLAYSHRSNLWLLHVYTVVETMYLLYFFLHLKPAPKARKAIQALLCLYPLMCVACLWLLQPIRQFNSYARCMEALILIGFSVNYWLDEQAQTAYEHWGDNPYNWVISGIMLYFSSSFLLFLFSNTMLADALQKPDDGLMRMIAITWNIHGTLVIVQYLLFTIGFRKYQHAG